MKKKTDSYNKLPYPTKFHQSLPLAGKSAVEVNLPVLKSVYELTLAIKPHTLRDLKLRLQVELLLVMLARKITIISAAIQNIQTPSSTYGNLR